MRHVKWQILKWLSILLRRPLVDEYDWEEELREMTHVPEDEFNPWGD